jgi:hypothetical protein
LNVIMLPQTERLVNRRVLPAGEHPRQVTKSSRGLEG